MSIFALLVILVILGLVAWLVQAKLPLAPLFKTIIYVVLVIIAVWLCLDAFGVLSEVRGTKVPSL